MIQRLSEINRVLRAIHVLSGTGPAARIPINSLVALCRSVVIEGRLPDHEATIQFMCTLGLLERSGDLAMLSDDGAVLLSLNPEMLYDLTQDQARFLVSRHYLSGAFSDDCRRLFGCFAISFEGGQLRWSESDGNTLPIEQWLLDHLLQLGVLVREKKGYRTSEAFYDAVVWFTDQPKGITEEQLLQSLKDKEELGDLAEQLMFEFERARLIESGWVVEAQCVRRISKQRVNAGFDLESFDSSSPDMAFNRFIEVKGSRQRHVRFYWSENEIKVAERLGEKYWIYFQGGIDPGAGRADVEPLLFQNPFVSVLQNVELMKTPHGLLVEGKRFGGNCER